MAGWNSWRRLLRHSYDFARMIYAALPLRDEWRWALKRLFFETLGRVYRGTELYQGYFQERRWREKVRGREDRSIATDPLDALTRIDTPCILLWGSIDWHFRVQRPQQLARAFRAAGYRVLYVSPLFEASKDPGFRAERVFSDGSLASIRLHLSWSPSVHEAPPDAATVEELRASTAELLQWSGASRFISLVQHPFWCEVAAHVPASTLVYDWIDDHAGFGTHHASFVDSEEKLLELADVVTVTAETLEERAVLSGANVLRVPNAADFEFLSTPPRECFRDAAGRPVVVTSVP